MSIARNLVLSQKLMWEDEAVRIQLTFINIIACVDQQNSTGKLYIKAMT